MTPNDDPTGEISSQFSRRTFLKRTAYSAAASTFAFSSSSLLVSCSSVGVSVPGVGSVTFTARSQVPPSWNGLSFNETDDGVFVVNNGDKPATITRDEGNPVTIPPGGSHYFNK
jgi:hypothetical protein